MSFKVGDKLVFVAKDKKLQTEYLETGDIVEISKSNGRHPDEVWVKNSKILQYYSSVSRRKDQLVPLEIYESPLYKALKEEE
jgi:(p)ppGpp synthase/HD superfamily hydrolase